MTAPLKFKYVTYTHIFSDYRQSPRFAYFAVVCGKLSEVPRPIASPLISGDHLIHICISNCIITITCTLTLRQFRSKIIQIVQNYSSPTIFINKNRMAFSSHFTDIRFLQAFFEARKKDRRGWMSMQKIIHSLSEHSSFCTLSCFRFF